MNLSAIISVLAAEQSSPASLAMTFIPLVLIIVFFYFFIIRPQKKQDKKDAEMRDNLEIGDEVVTNGGIVGIVFSIKDDTVVIESFLCCHLRQFLPAWGAVRYLLLCLLLRMLSLR